MNFLTKDLLWIVYQILRSVSFLLFQVLEYNPKVMQPQIHTLECLDFAVASLKESVPVAYSCEETSDVDPDYFVSTPLGFDKSRGPDGSGVPPHT